MVTSTGEIRVQPIAWAKNRLARIGVPARREVHVDDLAELVDRPEQGAPGPSDLQVGLIDVPAITDDVVSGSCGLGELWGEPLDPPVHRHVIDLDPAARMHLTSAWSESSLDDLRTVAAVILGVRATRRRGAQLRSGAFDGNRHPSGCTVAR